MGHLEKEGSSCAAMTGCLGREDVEVTILSKQYTESTMFRWTADNRVQIIESPFRKVNLTHQAAGISKYEKLRRECDKF